MPPENQPKPSFGPSYSNTQNVNVRKSSNTYNQPKRVAPSIDEQFNQTPQDSISRSAEIRRTRKERKQKRKSARRDDYLNNPRQNKQARPKTKTSVKKRVRRTVSAARAISMAVYPLFVLWMVQFYGFLVATAGYVSEIAAESIPLIGSIAGEVVPGMTVYGIGLVIILFAAGIGYAAMFLWLLFNGVRVLTWAVMLTAILTFAFHMVPLLQALPWIMIWLAFILYDNSFNKK